MESLAKVKESLPTPPPLFSSGVVSEQNLRVYPITSPYNLPQTSLVPSLTAPDNSRVMIVRDEVELRRVPGLMTCSFCQAPVTTEVTFQVGTFAWLMFLLFVVCGLILGCCLIPLFVNHFKDACHSCPQCKRVLHVEKRTCFK